MHIPVAAHPLLLPAAPPCGPADPLARAAAAMVAREAAISAALAAHSAVRHATRHLPSAERTAARRASSTAYMAAVDVAHVAYRAAMAPAAPPASVEPACSAKEVRFAHQFTVRLPHHAEPVKACADLRVHLGVPEVERVTIFPAGSMFATLAPRSDAFRRALREIRGPQAGAIRRRAVEIATADAELVEVVPTHSAADRALADLSAAIDRAEVRA